MWAFSLHDKKTEDLILCRDRCSLGIPPLPRFVQFHRKNLNRQAQCTGFQGQLSIPSYLYHQNREIICKSNFGGTNTVKI